MPKFAANISVLFTELPFLDRFSAAKKAGFDAVEILFPYDIAARDILGCLQATEQELLLINTPPPNWTGGDRGFAAIPGGQERFQHDFRRALRYAGVLGANMIHVMSGIAEGTEAHDTMIENLRWATAFAPSQKLTIEPINQVDMPGYFLNDFGLAAGILDEVSAPNLTLQFDAYHAHMITGDMKAVWEAHGARAGHIQIAGAPGRNEPHTGHVDYPAFFNLLDKEGYQGYVSAEYHPASITTEGLDWVNHR
ncbi:hydroxypyruvate isomerase [Shimia gijangensis]|uniref:Hydroxypyruvate isomerase n=1 Tax=Shimia gijangensis TaxID=1470563 RepID=A0A1M6BA46_9RHOB|nr:TIM barrel protein [Shimia gijangensis]SHI45585.1 hydroxypyruvate isomerase [Shimia gijangensis]